MCSWTWTSTWLDTYGDIVPHWFAIGTAADRVVGAVLVTCASLPGLANRGIGLVQLGTTNEPRGHSVDVEYNRLLVDEPFRRAFTRELLTTIQSRLHPVAIRAKSFLPADIEPALGLDPRFTPERHTCPVFDLERARDNGGDAIGELRSSVRSRIRRSNKALAPLDSEWAASVAEAHDILDDLIALHQHRWRQAGRPGAFASERFTRFHRELVAKLIPEHRVILFRVSHEGQTVGCLYSFIDGGMVMFYQSGLADFDDNRIKAGLTTHMLCIDACLGRGYHTYNFLAGDQRYKDELATAQRSLITAHAWCHAFMEPVVAFAEHKGALAQARRIKRWRERTVIGQTP